MARRTTHLGSANAEVFGAPTTDDDWMHSSKICVAQGRGITWGRI